MAALAKTGTKRRDMDMTQGSMAGNIIKFALPLFAGNLFQQLYNMVDTWVIGQRYGNDGGYAAVGSVGPIINILLGFFLGLSSGAGVIISQYYGAKDNKKVSETVHTAIKLTIIMSVVFTVVGVAMTSPILNLMLGGEGSSDVLPHAKKYLYIYFAGVSGMMFYNVGAGILRAVGDSRRPFYFLATAAVINTVLDLVFVFWFDMGVAGVALATVIAQFVSAAMTMYVLVKTDSCVKIERSKLKMEKGALKKIFFVGMPAAIQMAITAFSNVFVQSYISGVDIGGFVDVGSGASSSNLALSGWTSYSKIDQFIFLPVQSISLAVTTFVGQNLGNNDAKRARKGTWLGFAMAVGSAVFLIAAIELFTPFFASIFNSDPDTVTIATVLLRYITPFYVLCSVNQVFAASMRGAGNTKIPMFVMLGAFVGFRQIYLYVMSNHVSNGLLPIAMGYPAGWLVCAICMFVSYCLCDFSKSRLVED